MIYNREGGEHPTSLWDCVTILHRVHGNDIHMFEASVCGHRQSDCLLCTQQMKMKHYLVKPLVRYTSFASKSIAVLYGMHACALATDLE